MKTPLWKVSLAVWLPILVLLVVGYTVAYGTSYKHAHDVKNDEIAAAIECRKNISSPPISSTADNTPINPRVADFAKRYGGHGAGSGIASSPVSTNMPCDYGNKNITHGFLYLPTY